MEIITELKSKLITGKNVLDLPKGTIVVLWENEKSASTHMVLGEDRSPVKALVNLSNGLVWIPRDMIYEYKFEIVENPILILK